MKFSFFITLIAFLFLGCQTARKTPPKTAPIVAKKTAAKAPTSSIAQKTIYEELTGKKSLSAEQAPTRILELARDAKWRRDYVTAIKRYNTVIVKYPKSPQVRQAYIDKAELYKEMGLTAQSKYNMAKAKK